MKKSGSIKHPNSEHLCSTTSRRQVERPGEPNPLILPTNSAISEKQSPMKAKAATACSYEKSTTSFDAMEERAQMSSLSPQNSSASGLKQTRTLAKVLTKTPSLKHTRASAKQRSLVVRLENPNGQRATCSSTLKDHKFPAYLALNTGATQAEGSSATKVCPYTYCSLNGHHNDPLPSLKYFLSARRNMLKSQRCTVLGSLSSNQTNPHENITKVTAAERTNLVEKPPIQVGWSRSTLAPLIQDEEAGFFIGNNSKEREDNFQHDEDSTSLTDLGPSIGETDETRKENEQEFESASDEPLRLGVDSLKIYPPSQINGMSNLERSYSSGDNSLLHDFIFKSDKTAGSSTEADLTDEMVQRFPDVETVSEAWFSDDDSETTGSDEDSGSDILLASGCPSHKWFAPEDFNNRPDEYKDAMATMNSAPLKRAAKKQVAEEASEPEKETSNMSPEVGNGIEYIIKCQDNHLISHQKCKVPQDDATQQMRNQEFQSSRNMGSKKYGDSCYKFEDLHGTSANSDIILKKSVGSRKHFEGHQSDTLIEPTSMDLQAETSSEATAEEGERNKTLANETFMDQSQDSSSVNQSASTGDASDSVVKDSIWTIETAGPNDLESQTHPWTTGTSSPVNADQDIHKTQANDAIELGEINSSENFAKTCRIIEENELAMKLNPRAPNFLPLEPDQDAEKVDLKHLLSDEKKNTEEWMLDHALQQAVTKLTPARSRKVELLVEAFETVLPFPK